MIDKDLIRRKSEPELQYICRICGLKDEKGLTWAEIGAILNAQLGYNHTESCYRQKFIACNKNREAFENVMDNYDDSIFIDTEEDEDDEDIEDELSELAEAQIQAKKEKYKLSDQRNQYNSLIRREARREENIELASKSARIIAKEKPLFFPKEIKVPGNINKAGILCISDVHYGIEFKNFLNSYSPEIAKQRMKLLVEKTIEYGHKEGFKELYVANLGDMIAGMIHLQIRLESRENVVEQTMHMAEILAEVLNCLSGHFKVHYYDCLDNHSRVDANKDLSMAMESYVLFIPWYLKCRLEGNPNVVIHDAELDEDIMVFKVLGHNILGVHGHKDKPDKIVKELTCLTKRNYDLAIMGHRHHFSADEQQGVVVVSNGAMMGTDDYAKDLRVASSPTQNLIIVTEENACECIYRIKLD